MVAKKKKVTKPKAPVKLTMQDEMRLIINELTDIEVPEPYIGSPFIRKGFVECIDNTGFEDLVIKDRVYTVNELHMDGNKLHISCSDGNHHWLSDKMFKAIDYGPFKQEDQVTCLGSEGAVLEDGKRAPENLIGMTGIVIEGNNSNCVVAFGGAKITFPNENLRMRQRRTRPGKNPFKAGDRVKCVADGRNQGLNVGCLYTVLEAYDDNVRLVEDPDGDRYYHNMFSKIEVKKKVQKKFKINIEDFVRKFYNKYSYEKLTPSKLIKHMKEENVPKEYLNEEEIIKALKHVSKSVFHW